MHQLTGVDAVLLSMETPTQQGHVGGAVIVDPATAADGWGIDRVRALIEARLHLLPAFRRRLVRVALDIDRPYWIEDEHFDLGFHLRHIAVPPPGGAADLADLIARIHARPLDRSRPLWEMYLIEGLADGRVAVYTKVHQAAIDSLSGDEILTVLLDEDQGGREVTVPDEQWAGESLPSPVALFGRSAARMALSPARAVRVGYELARAIPGLARLRWLPAVVGVGDDEQDVLSRPKLVAPHSLLNSPITAHRRWAYGEVALDRLKAIKDATDTSLNDVVISIAAGAVRSWSLEHDDLPERSLQALIPMSVRGEDMESRISGMIAPIGTHLADPLERLEFVHHTMAVAKETHQATPAELLQDFAQFAPPAIAARAAQVVLRYGRAGRFTPFNLTIANIPGPEFALYMAGARLEGHYPVPTITAGAALNITLHRYLDRLCFGLVADRQIVPDVWVLIADIQKEVAALEERLG